MDHNHPLSQTQNQTESDRLLGIAEKLLQNRDLTGSREFALLAQETESLSEGSDQILAITDVLLASETRVNINNNRVCNWYSILQIEPRSEPDLVRKSYRRLALLLHPDKNNYPLADTAFKLVADAWGVLSDTTKRATYDHGLGVRAGTGSRPPNQPPQDKLPVRRSGGGGTTPTPRLNPNNTSGMNANNNGVHSRGVEGGSSNFWTTCPYCYVLYQYPKAYKECCMRCQNCERAFHAAVIPSLPPMVPGKEAYYCCWGFFPLGFSIGNKGKKMNGNVADNDNDNDNDNETETVNVNANADNNNPGNNTGFPNWMPGMFATAPTPSVPVRGVVDFSDGTRSGSGSKKRGRPRKNPVGY